METNNFALSEEQNMILDTVRKFVQDTVEPKALENDEELRFPSENIEGLGELGILGLPMSEPSGGAELGMLSFAVALEEIGRVCGSTARFILSHTGLCGMALDGASNGQALAQAAAMGDELFAWVGPESAITATANGESARIQGHAELVTGAMVANHFVVAAKTDDDEPLLVTVAADQAQRSAAASLGFRASAPGTVDFDCDATIQARSDDARAACDRARTAALIGGGAIAVAAALTSVDRARKHASERVAFGKPLDRQQAVRHKLAESFRAAQAARHLVFHAARLADSGVDCEQDARMAKLAAIDAAVLAADEGIQILGGYGYTAEYHVERFYRDTKTLEVLDGGSEMLRDAVAASLMV